MTCCLMTIDKLVVLVEAEGTAGTTRSCMAWAC